LYVWYVTLRVVGGDFTNDVVDDLGLRLHRFSTRAWLESGELVVHMRVVGHEGPASAMGDASQAARFEMARAGIPWFRIDVVHARRVSAT
jgi:hypothetical protein